MRVRILEKTEEACGRARVWRPRGARA
jgi:hypothetical protein